jgi:hypothetical protein
MFKYEDVVQNATGDAVNAATVKILLTGTSTLATIYSDNGVTPKTNPFTTDSLGRFNFYVADGRYDIEVSGTGITTYLKTDIEVHDVTSRSTADTDWEVNNVTVQGNLKLNTDVVLTRSAANTLRLATGNSFIPQTVGQGLGAVGSEWDLNVRNFTVTTSFTSSGDITTNGNFITKSGTAFTITLDHVATANRVFTLPDVTGNVAVLPTVATTETGTGDIVRATSPTIVTPTIGSFANATHSHLNAAGGGTLDGAAIAAGTITIARLPVGTANQLLKTNAAASSQENATLSVGTAGTDFAVAMGVGTITLNLPDASATVRGVVTTGVQTFGGAKTLNATLTGTTINVTSGYQVGGAALNFSHLAGRATTAQLPVGTANQLLGTNAGATDTEQKSLAVGTAGTDFAIAHTANTITFNLPDASGANRGAITTGTQTLAGAKTFSTAPTFSTITSSSVLFAGTGGLVTADSSNFVWDNSATKLLTVNQVLVKHSSAAGAINFQTGAALVGNNAYVAHTTSNQLDIRGGSSGLRVLNNAGTVATISITDGGVAGFLRISGSQGAALVAGDFVLSAGFGTTASIGTITGTDTASRFTVTSAGTGQGANPTITLTFKNGAWTTAPFAIVARAGGSQLTVVATWTVTTTTLVITFNGTPVAGETYTFSTFVMG